MYQFGPYGPNHATAGTFAFKRKLLENNKYDDDACLAEEKQFLKDYTVPFVQLDPRKTILVFSHEQNTFDKRKLLENPHPKLVKESDKLIKYFIKEKHLMDFYLNIGPLLVDYKPGDPSMKPDVLAQMIKIEESRRKNAENMLQKSGAGGQINMTGADGKPVTLTNPQIIDIIQKQQQQLQTQQQQLQTQQVQMQQIKSNYEKVLRENIELKSRLSKQETISSDIQSCKNESTDASGIVIDIS
jgi:hypothetical protein